MAERSAEESALSGKPTKELNITSDFSAQIAVLERIERYEKKAEYNRFLLIVSFGGLISLLAGGVEYITYRFYEFDVVFLLFGFLNNDWLDPVQEPVLFIFLWLSVITPVVIVLVFSQGKVGLFSWNRSYRLISLLAVALFLLSNVFVLLLGPSKQELLPLVWGPTIGLGLAIAGHILSHHESQPHIRLELYIIGFLVLLNSFGAVMFLPLETRMFSLLTFQGVVLVAYSSVKFLLTGTEDTA